EKLLSRIVVACIHRSIGWSNKKNNVRNAKKLRVIIVVNYRLEGKCGLRWIVVVLCID
ncbi:hypothetical protein Leryth_024952, partial [Lithospermum erythrorhizon]